MSVGAGAHSSPFSFYDSTDSNKKQQPIEAIVDNLIGGLRYRMDVRAVTEAGEGDFSAASDAVHAEMPILRWFPSLSSYHSFELNLKILH